MSKLISLLACCGAGLAVLTATCLAEETAGHWHSFRNGGSSTSISELPLHWSPETGITWQRELAGYGQSSPVIHAGTVYVTSVVGPQKEACAISAIDLATGAERWQYSFEAATTGDSNYMNSRAAPTPCVDDSRIICFFEGGDIVALSPDGKQLWHRDLNTVYGPLKTNHGLGSSLAQSDQLVMLNVEHNGPSMLVALDKATGATKWTVERPSGSSWSSPVLTATDPPQVVVSSSGSVTGYSVDDGSQLWQIDGLSGNTVPSPVVTGNRLLTGARIPEFGSAEDAASSNLCVAFPDQAGAAATVAWRAEDAVCDYASPVVCGDRAFYLNKVGVLSCVDLHTGKTLYRQRLRVECWATPIVSQDQIYFFGKDGKTVIVGSGPEFSLTAENHLWDPASPPQPESYVEATSSRGHGPAGGASSTSAGADAADGKAPADASAGGGRMSRMVGMLLRGDKNADGLLTPSEVPSQFTDSFDRLDLNADGQLDRTELDAMAKSFAERRASSRVSSRDPIVYGVAAADGAILIRTGTRLYCVAANGAEAAGTGATP
jgi:outer membrane protein assembly factor BamB